MRIQYMSDLHMEFAENSRYIKHNEFPVTGDVLVSAGDTFYLNNTVAPLSKFWKWASANYRQVLLVPGNHEYYQFCDVMERGLQWKWMLKDNVGIYQNQVVRIDNTDFILSTLWSNIPAQDEYFVWKGLNDFRQTKYKGKLIQVNEYNQLHKRGGEYGREDSCGYPSLAYTAGGGSATSGFAHQQCLRYRAGRLHSQQPYRCMGIWSLPYQYRCYHWQD